MDDMNYSLLKSDSAMLVKMDKKGQKIIILVYVNDLIFTSNHNTLLEADNATFLNMFERKRSLSNGTSACICRFRRGIRSSHSLPTSNKF